MWQLSPPAIFLASTRALVHWNMNDHSLHALLVPVLFICTSSIFIGIIFVVQACQ
jgi:hypothetical protein